MKKRLLIIFAPLIIFSTLFVGIRSAFASDVYIVSSPTFFIQSGQFYQYKIAAKSVNNYQISYTFPSLPTWLSFNSSNAILSGSTASAGRYTINVVANDNHGATDEQSYYLYVTAPQTQTNTPTPSEQPTAQITQTSVPTTKQSPTLVNTSPTIVNAKLTVVSLSPSDNSTLTDTSPLIKAVIRTDFPFDKKNFSVYLDNIYTTPQISLASTSANNGLFDNTFTFQAHNLADGLHNVSLAMVRPDGITLNQNWSFKIIKTTPAQISAFTTSIKNFILSHLIIFGALLAILLIFIVIIVKLIRQGAKISQQKESTPA